MTTEPPPEIAFYYPEPYWLGSEGGQIKNLLLFFDEIATLLPSYMEGREIVQDPTLAGPLSDRGLLKTLRPETFVDEEAGRQLFEVIAALIEGGAFDDLSNEERFAELSTTRMGSMISRDIFGDLRSQLEEKGLAKPTEDGVSIPLHPAVRGVYLIVLAQLARDAGARQGLDLHPVTTGRGDARVFERFLELGPMPSRGHIAALDAEVVSIDLETVPLDDVLGFRDENQDSTAATCRTCVSSPWRPRSRTTPTASAPADRKADLEDEARDLRQRTIDAFKSKKKVSGFALGLVGAAWSIAADSVVPGALAALGGGLNMLPTKAEGSAYSYLFKATERLP